MSQKHINTIFEIIDTNNYVSMKTKIMGTVFYQPSTRTRLSFEIAMSKLGGQTVGFSDMKTSRCFDNYFDETLDDFVRVIAEMVDFVVVRHFENNIPEQISQMVDIPVINAGDGTNEHPTQALQDIWLMRNKAGTLEGKVIGFLGDISRNHRSIVFGLRHLGVSKLIFLLPPTSVLPEDIEVFLIAEKIPYEFYSNLADVLAEADFINSFTPSMRDLEKKTTQGLNYVSVLNDYIINRDLYEKTNSHAYILNAGPRTYEVAKDMDSHPNFLFFQQVKVGITVRKGVLSYLLNPQITYPNATDTYEKILCD